MFSKLSYTWQIMGASWEVLKKDKEMVLFALLSGICCLIVIASFLLPLALTDGLTLPEEEMTAGQQVLMYGLLFLFYFCNYFVITFFNSAIVACTVKRLGGGDPTFGDGIGFALSALPQILGWSLLSATVGLILRVIEDRSERAGQIIAALLGTAWTAVTFLVVPVLVVEKKGPIAAFKRSVSLLKKTWGESLAGHYSFGFVFFLLSIPGIALILAGIFGGASVGSGALAIAGIALGVIYLLGLGLVQSTLHAIFRAVVYAYAETGTVPEVFDDQLLRTAMGPRT